MRWRTKPLTCFRLSCFVLECQPAVILVLDFCNHPVVTLSLCDLSTLLTNIVIKYFVHKMQGGDGFCSCFYCPFEQHSPLTQPPFVTGSCVQCLSWAMCLKNTWCWSLSDVIEVISVSSIRDKRKMVVLLCDRYHLSVLLGNVEWNLN